ncbi:hypothetical protein [Shewanella baltica]|uniref:hypothetical protein n=1 Tax=Shewanella baltica TaxID=62322 RepID=UPI00131AF16C|nr:hypothetical protein [Shewanella baltica]
MIFQTRNNLKRSDVMLMVSSRRTGLQSEAVMGVVTLNKGGFGDTKANPRLS